MDNQDTLEYYIHMMTDFFNLHPLLWSLYPVLLILPFVAIATFCINPNRNQRENQTQQRKHSEEPRDATSKSPSARSSSSQPSPVRQRKSARQSSKQDTDAPVSKQVVNGQRAAPPAETADAGDYDRLSPLPRNVDVAATEEEEEEDQPNWQFPPVLDEFNLIDVDVDPAILEEVFADKRLVEVRLRLQSAQGLGITIVGGKESANGDVPIYIKRILPNSPLQREGKLKSGDELVAVNDVLLVNTTKEYASEILTNIDGHVRLLALQDL